MPSQESLEIATLHRLHHLMSQMNAGHDLDEVLQIVVDGVADIAGFAVAAISRLDTDRTLVMVAVAGDDDAKDQLLGRRLPLEEMEQEFALADHWGILRFVPHDRLADEQATGWVPDFVPEDAPDAWHPLDALFAPITAPNGEMVGLLSVDVPHNGRRPKQSQRDVLEMYAVQAGIAISNAQQRERLREEVRLGVAVHAIMQTAGTRLDLESVVDDSLEPVVEGLRCKGVLIRAFEGVGELPGRGYGRVHPSSSTVDASQMVSAATARIARMCWSEQRTTLIGPGLTLPEDIATLEETRAVADFAADLGARHILLVPLGAGPECLGYMAMTRPIEDSAWTEVELAAVLGIGRDIGRAMLHARLFEREREVNEKLLELDQYKTELIATIAHELRTPLTSILGHVEMMESMDVAPIIGRSVGAIERNAVRIQSLAEDLLLLSRVQDPHRPVPRVQVDLAMLLQDSVEMFRVQSDTKKLTVTLERSDDPVFVTGDAVELDRVITNLIGNAVKFSLSGRTISLALTETDNEVVFVCRDQGIGISPADQEKLFTEFFRSTNPEALAVPGTGLGLSIVKRIVTRHGGEIALTSMPGLGSTFTVRLPRSVPGPSSLQKVPVSTAAHS